MTKRQRAYEIVSDHYGRHINGCLICGSYAGPPLAPCRAGERFVARMARLVDEIRAEREESAACATNTA